MTYFVYSSCRYLTGRRVFVIFRYLIKETSRAVLSWVVNPMSKFMFFFPPLIFLMPFTCFVLQYKMKYNTKSCMHDEVQDRVLYAWQSAKQSCMHAKVQEEHFYAWRSARRNLTNTLKLILIRTFLSFYNNSIWKKKHDFGQRGQDSRQPFTKVLLSKIILLLSSVFQLNN